MLTPNPAEASPEATVIEGAVTSSGLLLDNATAIPPAGAAFVKLTVQEVVPLVAMLPGRQATAETSAGLTRFNVAAREEPLRAAVTIAGWSVEMAPALTWNVAEVIPPPSAIEAGLARSALLEDSATAMPSAGAALVKVTVQSTVVPDPRSVVPQIRDESSAGATRLTLAVRDEPLRAAVMVAG